MELHGTGHKNKRAKIFENRRKRYRYLPRGGLAETYFVAQDRWLRIGEPNHGRVTKEAMGISVCRALRATFKMLQKKLFKGFALHGIIILLTTVSHVWTAINACAHESDVLFALFCSDAPGPRNAKHSRHLNSTRSLRT
jgi:hypothetical protein